MKNEKEFLYRLLMLLAKAGVGIYLFTLSASFFVIFGGFFKEFITPAMFELLLGTLKNI